MQSREGRSCTSGAMRLAVAAIFMAGALLAACGSTLSSGPRTTATTNPSPAKASPSHVTLVGIPSPGLETGGLFGTSSCVKGPVCVVIGWNHHGNNGFTWVERWRDGTWSRLPPPPNSGESGISQQIMSCSSATWCMVTGQASYRDGSNHPYSATLNGTRWTIHPVATVKGTTDFSLFELDCVSKTWCMAVGSYVASKPNYADAQFLVSEVWNGSEWRLVSIFSPKTYGPQLDPGFVAGGEHPTAAPQQLSCVSSNFCMFAGFWTGVFVEQWDGTSWHQVTAPNASAKPSSASEFSGGTCASANWCVGTGGYAVANGIWRPLIDQWNGVHWFEVALPRFPLQIAGKTGFRLGHVRCETESECVAFGEISSRLLAMEWNGRSWHYVSTRAASDPQAACLPQRLCAASA
jgi:hypothetical protein